MTCKMSDFSMLNNGESRNPCMHQSHENGPVHVKFAIPDRYGACPAGDEAKGPWPIVGQSLPYRCTYCRMNMGKTMQNVIRR